MVKRRPVNLNLLTLHFPITAWVSIAHRLSGISLVLLTPLLLWALQISLASEEQFIALNALLRKTPIIQLCIWMFLTVFLYHFIAGLRHLLLDLQVGDSKTGGRRGAQWLLIGWVICVGLAGYWVW